MFHPKYVCLNAIWTSKITFGLSNRFIIIIVIIIIISSSSSISIIIIIIIIFRVRGFQLSGEKLKPI